METWEMVKELTEHPDKKFKYGGQLHSGYITVQDKRIVWVGESQTEKNLILWDFRNTNWTEIKKKEVTWQEAIQAWIEGNDIECVLDTFIYAFKKSLGEGSTLNISADLIKRGKWYIEQSIMGVE